MSAFASGSTRTGLEGSQWGPFERGIAAAECIARLRAVRALALVFAHHDPGIHFILRKAEATLEPEALDRAQRAIDRLPAIGKRRLLATYADLVR